MLAALNASDHRCTLSWRKGIHSIIIGMTLMVSSMSFPAFASTASSSSSTTLPLFFDNKNKAPTASNIDGHLPSSFPQQPKDASTQKQKYDDKEMPLLTVVNRDGTKEPLYTRQIYELLESLMDVVPNNDGTFQEENQQFVDPFARLDDSFVNLETLTHAIVQGLQGLEQVTDDALANVMAETAASRATQHDDYARLAARIVARHLHAQTPSTFSQAMAVLYNNDNYDAQQQGGEEINAYANSQQFNKPNNHDNGIIHSSLYDFVQRHASVLNDAIRHDRDYEWTYLGLKTLERSYLLRMNGRVVERPQYLLMRVALGIHCCKYDSNDDTPTTKTCLENDKALQDALETYRLLSRGMIMHASPTLFYAGTKNPQLSSCFLLQIPDDSISTIFDTLKQCALISKSAGGIGLAVHPIRARKSNNNNAGSSSSSSETHNNHQQQQQQSSSSSTASHGGLIPLLRVFDTTSRYADQGGGKRPGAFCIYLEPWHADIFNVLLLRKNHGKEEHRARDLFYALWISDLFMKRVQEDDWWSLMCPQTCPGLAECHGPEFERLYQEYEAQGKYLRRVRARDLWTAILEAQMETGTPFMLYKDAANAKSNHVHMGTIQCSNLCTEIIQYTNEEEVAVCNLANVCLPKFVVSKNRGPYGSPDPDNEDEVAYFDHEELHRVVKILTRNLNKVLDVTQTPVPGARLSNQRHRAIGIGVAGLADCFIRMGLPFCSPQAKALNRAIFETMYHAACQASAELARQHGPYPTFEGSPASKGKLQFDLWQEYRKQRQETYKTSKNIKKDDSEDFFFPSHRYAMMQKEKEQGSKQVDDDTMPLQKYPHAYQESGYDWTELKQQIQKTGLRNSLLLAPMPTASTSQLLGVQECFEPYSSNLYIRRVQAGEFILMNPHLIADLTRHKNLWNASTRQALIRNHGSIANLDSVPTRLQQLYKTVWEWKMKDIVDMAADRGPYIDQSQSLNVYLAQPTLHQLNTLHFYAWNKGLKTGMYYLRTKPAVHAIQYTVDGHDDNRDDYSNKEKDTVARSPNTNAPSAVCENDALIKEDDMNACQSCQT